MQKITRSLLVGLCVLAQVMSACGSGGPSKLAESSNDHSAVFGISIGGNGVAVTNKQGEVIAFADKFGSRQPTNSRETGGDTFGVVKDFFKSIFSGGGSGTPASADNKALSAEAAKGTGNDPKNLPTIQRVGEHGTEAVTYGSYHAAESEMAAEMSSVSASARELTAQEAAEVERLVRAINAVAESHNKSARTVVATAPELLDVARQLGRGSFSTSADTPQGQKVRDLSSNLDNLQGKISQLPRDQQQRKQALLAIAKSALSQADQLYAAGDQAAGDAAYEMAYLMADAAAGFTPVVGVVKDLFEAATGKSAIDGRTLDKSARIFAAVGVLTLGATNVVKIVKNARALSKLAGGADDVVDAASSIARKASDVRPILGNKFVSDLPDLDGSLKEAFDGHIFKGVYEPGEILFQAQRTGQSSPGHWFGPTKPINAAHAEALFNIRKWGNDAGQLKAFIVKERVSGYAGKVAGGEGHQFYIPSHVDILDVLEEVR